MICILAHPLVHMLAILDLTSTPNMKLAIRICGKLENPPKIFFFFFYPKSIPLIVLVLFQESWLIRSIVSDAK